MTKLGNYICSQQTKSDRVGSYLHLVGRTDLLVSSPYAAETKKHSKRSAQ